MGPSALLYLHRKFFLNPLFVCVCCVTQYPTSEMAAGASDTLWLFEVRQPLNRVYKDEDTPYREQFVPSLLTTVGLSLREEL